MKLKSIDRAIRKIGSAPKYIDPTVAVVDKMRQRYLSGKRLKSMFATSGADYYGRSSGAYGIYGASGSIASKFK